jgi:hypothetical protein
VEVTFALAMANGAAQGSVAVARCITERIQREREAAAQTNLSSSP